MSSAASYVVSDAEIDKKRVEEIDLVMVVRYFRMLDRYFSSEDIVEVQNDDDDEAPKTSIKSRLIDYFICSSHYYVERQIALRMIFGSILAAPERIVEIERILGLRLTDNENNE